MPIARPSIVARNISAPPVMANQNAQAQVHAYNGIPIPTNNNNMPTTQMPQHQQFPPGRLVSPIVSPVGSPMHTREFIFVNQNQPVHLPNQLGSPENVNNNTTAWPQQRQQPLQINTARSYESDDADNESEVSSIHMGSIRPVANYDPAKDPTSPENFDKPFIAPLEITIRVVHGRRRKTMSSYHSSTTHTTAATNTTTITPPHSSTADGERQSEWFQSPEVTVTQSGSIPQLGPINSFVSDGTDSNSFSGSVDQYQSAQQIMRLEEELQGMQEGSNNEEAKQRKGMVRREFNRRIMRFSKGKKKNKNSKTPSNDLSGDDEDDLSDASGNKIIIKLKIDDSANNKTNNAPELQLQPPKQHFKGIGGIIKGHKGHRRSKSLQMVFDQENGC